MTTVIGLHEQYALVSPLDFKSAMNGHWANDLQMPSSPALRSLWETMGRTFQRSVIDTINERDTPWRVLQPPTGSGKTEGACLYSSLQAKLNAESQGELKPVGILLVTRLIEQADRLAARVNELAGATVAIAHHSKSETNTNDIHAFDVLVVTHQAFVNAAENLGASSWSRLVEWKGGQRLLKIVDEALANVVEENKVTLENIQFTLGCVPLEVGQACPEQLQTLEALKSILLQRASSDGDGDDSTATLLWHEGQTADALASCETNMQSLRDAMRHFHYDRVIGEENSRQRVRIASRVDNTLEDAQAIAERWAYYARVGKEHSLNSSALLVPHGVPGAVVLDATANQNFLWDLFQGRADIVPVCSGARNYANVILHVARAKGVGKTSMAKSFTARYTRLLEALEAELGSERSVFICTHKAHEHTAQSFEHRFAKLEVGHWGAIDGHNDWKDYEAAVIFGLPYRDLIWPTNVFFALQGVQDDDWLKSPNWQGHKDVRSVMQQRQLSVSIIQAINRVRCRKVVDEYGGCEPADIFIVLPDSKIGDAILADIRADMPDINVVPWAFELDGERVRRPRKASSHEALITLMRNRPPGETALSMVQRELGLKQKGLERLRAVLRDASHVTTKALKELGVEFVMIGKTKGARSFLVKHQTA